MTPRLPEQGRVRALDRHEGEVGQSFGVQCHFDDPIDQAIEVSGVDPGRATEQGVGDRREKSTEVAWLGSAQWHDFRPGTTVPPVGVFDAVGSETSFSDQLSSLSSASNEGTSLPERPPSRPRPRPASGSPCRLFPKVLEPGGHFLDRVVAEQTRRAFDGVGVPDQVLYLAIVELSPRRLRAPATRRLERSSSSSRKIRVSSGVLRSNSGGPCRSSNLSAAEPPE